MPKYANMHIAMIRQQKMTLPYILSRGRGFKGLLRELKRPAIYWTISRMIPNIKV